MPLRPTMTDDIPFIDKLDGELFADHETYPFRRPILAYYAAFALNMGAHQQNDAELPPAAGMQFFTLFRNGHVAGVLVLRPWQVQSPFPRGRYDERDGELFYLGVAPEHRGSGLGMEAFQFALQEHVRHNRHGTTLTRFKPACTIYRSMLDHAGFEFLNDPSSGRTIGYRYSYDTLITIPRKRSPDD